LIKRFNYGVGEATEGGALVRHPDEVWYRLSLDASEPWKVIALVRQPDAALAGLVSDARYNLHDGPLPLQKEKIADLAKFKAWIPPEYHVLYPDPAPEDLVQGSDSELEGDGADSGAGEPDDGRDDSASEGSELEDQDEDSEVDLVGEQ
jgi:hypothetical protein